jgi:penicillin-binding protein 1C
MSAMSTHYSPSSSSWGEGAASSPSPLGGEGRDERFTAVPYHTRPAPLTPALSLAGRGRRTHLRRAARFAVIAFALIVISAIAGAAVLIASLSPAPRGEGLSFSTLVVDRDGRLLRPYTTEEGRWRLPATRADVDPRFLNLLFAYEDKRFLDHHGVDPLALGRAIAQFIVNGRTVSGGSTLTMQVARLLEPRERTLVAKLRQIVRALELERTLNKDQILALYLSLAPYGGNLEGIRAASLAYFGREPRRLNLAESALLVALPQSPEQRRPDRSVAAARHARDRVLDRIAAAGLVPADEVARAKQESVPDGRRPMPMLAPHAADAALAAVPGRSLHRLTIDASLQKSLEELARERARALGPELSVAILAVDNATGEVLARVASADYFDTARAGQVDMTLAVRSPGSTLKPFIYGLGFEDGLIHPETLIEDRPVRYGGYAPENFDLTFQGTVTVRRALQLSLNVPAVAVLDKVGASRFTARLAQAGGALVLPKGEAPGLAMGLGGVGVKLADLVMLYSGLARIGSTVPLTERFAGENAPPTHWLMEPVAAWYVGNVLLGTPPPENATGGRIAFKTGTSYGYRDAWSVGFDGRITIGVWVGRPDGAPVPGLVGRAAAAPILFDAFARTGKLPAPLPPTPKDALVASTAKLPPPLQRFRPDRLPGEAAEPQLRIMFPPNGARLELESGEGGKGGKPDPVALKVTGGSGPLTVLVNGLPLPSVAGRRTLFFEPDGPGFVRLTVIDETGATDSVMVRLQ